MMRLKNWVLAATLACCSSAWAQTFGGGSGTEGDPYKISTTDHWNELADCLAGEKGEEARAVGSKHFKLDNNIGTSIPITRMVGADVNHAFTGHFDGNGHTINIDLTTTADFCGPFAYTYGATIKNLKTTGTIQTSARYAGGVVGRNGISRLNLYNVTSSVTINSTYAGEAFHGGLVGYAINATFEGCSFTGSLLGPDSYRCGGLLGWKSMEANDNTSNATFINCLSAPTSVTVGQTNTRGFACVTQGSVAYFTNCYYANESLGTDQCRMWHSITTAQNGNVWRLLANGTATAYSMSGITAYKDGNNDYICGISYGGTLYAGRGDLVTLVLNNGSDNVDPSTGYEKGYYYMAGDEQVVIGTDDNSMGEDDVCSFTMPDQDIAISAGRVAIKLEGSGTVSAPYLIKTTNQWNALAQSIRAGNSREGEYFQLAENISITSGLSMLGENDRPFSGIFDGGGHTINIALPLSWSCNNYALFHYTKDATIKNLHVTGTIQTKHRYAGGVVGNAKGTTLQNVKCSVAINSRFKGDARHGGLVGSVLMGDTDGTGINIEGCVFTGSLLGAESELCCGLVGTLTGTATANITNSLFIPAEVTVSNSGADAILYRGGQATIGNIHNCYYANTTLRSTHGQQPLTVIGGTDVTVIVAPKGESTATHDVSGITAYTDGIVYNNRFYYGSNDEVSVNLSYTGSLTDYSYFPSAGSLTGTANPYTLTMPDNTVNVTINAYNTGDYEKSYQGTADDPYIITTASQLNLLAQRVNGGNSYSGKYFRLETDINYTHSTDWNAENSTENNFTPIGYYHFVDEYLACSDPGFTGWDYISDEEVKRPFAGHFDGNGHTISGIRIHKPLTTADYIWNEEKEEYYEWAEPGSHGYDEFWDWDVRIVTVEHQHTHEVVDAYGLFAYVTGEVKNLTLSDARIAGPQYVGGIVGRLEGTVNNCHVGSDVNIRLSADTQEGQICLGGISGWGGSVSNSISAAHLNSSKDGEFGGIVGHLPNGKSVIGSFALGAWIPRWQATTSGAIVGNSESQNLQNNYYYSCKVANNPVAEGIGCNSADIATDNGAVPGFVLYDNPAQSNLNEQNLTAFNNYSPTRVVLADRTLYKDGDWNTLCLPFNVTIANSPLSGDGVTAKVLNATGTNLAADGMLTLSFTEASTIEAGTPFIIKWPKSSSDLVNPVFENVTIDASEKAKGRRTVNFSGGSFEGTWTPFDINSSNKDEIILLTSGNKLGYSQNDRTLRSFRAHFHVPTTNGNRGMSRYVIDFGDESAGIGKVEADASAKEAWFTLDGRKLPGQPTQKGVYVMNGKKTIIK